MQIRWVSSQRVVLSRLSLPPYLPPYTTQLNGIMDAGPAIQIQTEARVVNPKTTKWDAGLNIQNQPHTYTRYVWFYMILDECRLMLL
jgi:hypothetical protein